MRTFLLFLFLLAGLRPAQALFTQKFISAYRVGPGQIQVDGKPEAIWGGVARAQDGSSSMDFTSHANIILVGKGDSLRNVDPAPLYPNPKPGAVRLLAAYDSLYLYFLFTVEGDAYFGKTENCVDAELWRADALELFLDTSPWSEAHYPYFFSAQDGGGAFGTSERTIQVSKPLNPEEKRVFFKNREADQKFIQREMLQKLPGFAAKQQVDPSGKKVILEMRIPYWAKPSQSQPARFQPGNSHFISWAYNNYLDSFPDNCSEYPVKYSWSKHHKLYPSMPISARPPGFIPNDSTHYDPTRSYDGWGRLYLHPSTFEGSSCSGEIANPWDFQNWNGCAAVGLGRRPKPVARFRALAERAGPFRILSLTGQELRKVGPGETGFPGADLRPGLYLLETAGRRERILLP